MKTRHVIHVLIATALLISSSVHSQNLPNYPSLNSEVNTDGGFPIYKHAPSKWTGNWFNWKADDIDHGASFKVLMSKEYPSLVGPGNQIWIKIAPIRESKSALSDKFSQCGDKEECWAFYGWHGKKGGQEIVKPENFTLQENGSDG